MFVANLGGGKDYSSASVYGAIRPLSRGKVAVYKTDQLTEEIIKALVESTPDDYLVISGSAGVNALCLALWMIQHKQCNMLFFDPTQGAYVLRILKRNEIQLGIEYARIKREEQLHGK